MWPLQLIRISIALPNADFAMVCFYLRQSILYPYRMNGTGIATFTPLTVNCAKIDPVGPWTASMIENSERARTLEAP